MAHRLPPLSASLLIVMTALELQRDLLGTNWCLDNGIGAIRRKLGPPPQDPSFAERTPVGQARDGARMLLCEMCADCPLIACPAKSWLTSLG